MQGCLGETLDLQQEGFPEITGSDACGVKGLHQTDQLFDLLRGDGEPCFEEQIILDLLHRASQVAVAVDIANDVAGDLTAHPLKGRHQSKLVHEVFVQRRRPSSEGYFLPHRLALLELSELVVGDIILGGIFAELPVLITGISLGCRILRLTLRLLVVLFQSGVLLQLSLYTSFELQPGELQHLDSLDLGRSERKGLVELLLLRELIHRRGRGLSGGKDRRGGSEKTG